MKYLVLADYHDDFWREDNRNPIEGIEDEIASLDLLVLAGDISNKPKVRWKPALRRFTDLLDPAKIHVFPGNHDFYNYRLDAEDRLIEFAAEAGVHYANHKIIHAGGARFICTTLWTDFELPPGRIQNESHIPTKMNDYRIIRLGSGGYRRVRPSDTIAIHHKDRKFIEEALAAPFDGPSFVVTHHAPHPGVLKRYADNLDAAYASDLSNLIERLQPDAWFFGHCHDANEITVAGCPLKNISLGYPMDVKDPAARIKSLIATLP